MSLRPSASTPNSVTFPADLKSPTQAADKRHQAQLASYKRNPVKGAAAARLASKRQAWTGEGRRLSAVVENGEDHEEKDRSYRARNWLRYTSSFVAPYSPFAPEKTKKRLTLYFMSCLALYIFLLRPLSTSKSSVALPGAASEGARAGPSTPATPVVSSNTPPLLQRRNALQSKRPALPGHATRKSAIEHKVERGVLHVNPDSPVHPIYQLIRDAREEWNHKVARQSKTLEEAVVEYRKRYGMQPPAGFDKWWAYIVENDVQLPDEYDQIHRDLLPFRGLSPAELNRRIDAASQMPDTYTLKVRHGSIRTSASYDRELQGADARLDGQMELLKPVAKWIPDMSAVYWIHDTPTNLIGWDHKAELIEHFEEDEWFREDEDIDLTLRGFHSACPPQTRLRQAIRDGLTEFDSSYPSTELKHKTFISSHSAVMDICDRPEMMNLHGAFLGKDPVVQDLTPIFSLSKTNLHADVLGVATEQWQEHMKQVPWSEKNDDRLLWRGSTTGMAHSVDTPWRQHQRTRLIEMANGGFDRVMTLLPPPKAMRGESITRIHKEADWDEMNEEFLDVTFTGGPLQCDDEVTCQQLGEGYAYGEMVGHDEAVMYKFVLDVDGNAWSARFKRLLTSGSLIFKSTIMPEWWTDRIQPWVHYVPVQVDYSDLYDALVFFRGDLNGRGGEDRLAADIAAMGRDWSLTQWRTVDMTAYVFRLYLEWARLVAPSRARMDFNYDPDMELYEE